MQPRLASRFGRHSFSFRSNEPLSDDQIRRVAPSVFADGKHESRSERYTYIPTVDVLTGLRREGFEPFMVAQSRARNEAKREHTKHLIRLRHRDQINASEANEIVMVNSHDGTSSYQMMGGQFRFLCLNGMISGNTSCDVRIPHKGNIIEEVIEGAYEVLDGFTRVIEEREGMKGTVLDDDHQIAFARAALALRFDTETAPAPITERQILEPRRIADRASDLWTVFNRVQENSIRGGLDARTTTGRRTRTREVAGIDSNVKLNRALWVLAEEMRKLRG